MKLKMPREKFELMNYQKKKKKHSSFNKTKKKVRRAN